MGDRRRAPDERVVAQKLGSCKSDSMTSQLRSGFVYGFAANAAPAIG